MPPTSLAQETISNPPLERGRAAGTSRRILEAAVHSFTLHGFHETDYPHPTCMAPGPASAGTHPGLYVEKVLEGIPDAVVSKALHDSAANLYGIA